MAEATKHRKRKHEKTEAADEKEKAKEPSAKKLPRRYVWAVIDSDNHLSENWKGLKGKRFCVIEGGVHNTREDAVEKAGFARDATEEDLDTYTVCRFMVNDDKSKEEEAKVQRFALVVVEEDEGAIYFKVPWEKVVDHHVRNTLDFMALFMKEEEKRMKEAKGLRDKKKPSKEDEQRLKDIERIQDEDGERYNAEFDNTLKPLIGCEEGKERLYSAATAVKRSGLPFLKEGEVVCQIWTIRIYG